MKLFLLSAALTGLVVRGDAGASTSMDFDVLGLRRDKWRCDGSGGSGAEWGRPGRLAGPGAAHRRDDGQYGPVGA